MSTSRNALRARLDGNPIKPINPPRPRSKAPNKVFYERDIVMGRIKEELTTLLQDPANQQSEAFNTPTDFDFLIDEAIDSTAPLSRTDEQDDPYIDFNIPFGLEQLSGFRDALNQCKNHNPRRGVGIHLLLKATNAAQEALWDRPAIGFSEKPNGWQR